MKINTKLILKRYVRELGNFHFSKTMYLYISNFYDTIKYFLKDMTFKCFIYTNNIANINKSDALKYELFCYDLKCLLYFILHFC